MQMACGSGNVCSPHNNIYLGGGNVSIAATLPADRVVAALVLVSPAEAAADLLGDLGRVHAACAFQASAIAESASDLPGGTLRPAGARRLLAAAAGWWLVLESAGPSDAVPCRRAGTRSRRKIAADI